MKKVSDFKTRLQQLLALNDMKPTDLAKRTGITDASISRYLKNDREPTSDKIEIVANFFGVEIGWMMGWEDDEAKPITQNERAFLETLRKRPKLLEFLTFVYKLSDKQIDSIKPIVEAIVNYAQGENNKRDDLKDA